MPFERPRPSLEAMQSNVRLQVSILADAYRSARGGDNTVIKGASNALEFALIELGKLYGDTEVQKMREEIQPELDEMKKS